MLGKSWRRRRADCFPRWEYNNRRHNTALSAVFSHWAMRAQSRVGLSDGEDLEIDAQAIAALHQ